jgi:hypothetical protein
MLHSIFLGLYHPHTILVPSPYQALFNSLQLRRRWNEGDTAKNLTK